MKPIIFITFFIVLLMFIHSCKQWEMPSHLEGNWQSKQQVKVRIKSDGKYVFLSAQDSVLLKMKIDQYGNITGTLGNAIFESCKVQKNRGELGRTLNLATDFVIKGKLKGKIFDDDPYSEKEISAPFDVSNNKMNGSIFQLFGFDLFPVSGLDATKQN